MQAEHDHIPPPGGDSASPLVRTHSVDPDLAARVLAALNSPLIICDPAQPDNPIVYANPAFGALTGYAPPETLGRNCRFLQGSGTDPRAVGEIGRTMAEGRAFRGVIRNYDRDGAPFWNDLAVAPVRDGRGELTHWVGVQSDVSESVLAQEALRAASTRLETLIASLQAGVLVEDDRGQVVLANQAFCDMAGIGSPPGALVGANALPLARGAALLFKDPAAFLERALQLRRGRQALQAEELCLADGRAWECDYAPVFPGGAGHVGHLWLFRDVTERRRIEARIGDAAIVLEFQMAELEATNAELEAANARLEEANARLAALATTDGLTGLLNHRVFGERLAEEYRRARRYGEELSLIVLDVDRFKSYNDSFGHLAGNSVLRELARVLRGHARETDIVARFGGEEFALILPHTGVRDAVLLAGRLRAAVEGAGWDARRSVTASFGVCELAPETADSEALIACADAALYRAKAEGRNRVAHG